MREERARGVFELGGNVSPAAASTADRRPDEREGEGDVARGMNDAVDVVGQVVDRRRGEVCQ